MARLLEMLHDDGLLGVHFYDAGVYYTAADALIHGQMPYQGFLFIEAPGVIFVSLPFALLGNLTSDSIGLASANVAFAVVGAACTAMVAVNLRRFGLTAVVCGGFFYAALTSYALALVIGVACGKLAAALPARGGTTAGLSVVLMAGMLAVSLPNEIQTTAPTPPLAGLRHAAADVRGCVLSDSNAILAAMNVLSRDMAEGCHLWPDTTGWTFDAYAQKIDGQPVPRGQNTVWQEHAVGYLTSGDAMLQYHVGTLLDEHSARLVREGPVLFHGGDPWTLYATPRPLGPAPSTPARVDATRWRQ